MLRIANIKTDEIDADIFGGKAAGLSLLAQNGCLIPDSIAIEGSESSDDIDCPEFQDALSRVLAPYNKDGKYDLAVRSSCTVEDGFVKSMAGFFDSVLGDMTFSEILLNMKKVISGIDKVISDGYPAKMGIVIQPLICADYAGVLFSSDPISYSKKQVSITYTEGIGDKLVSGEASGKEAIFTIQDDQPVLNDGSIDPTLKQSLAALANNCKQLEAALHYPLDIEWAIAGSEIYYLQCRPLTSITAVQTALVPVKAQELTKLPPQLISHDKIQLRLMAKKNGLFISDAYAYINNTSCKATAQPELPKSEFCKGYSAVIIYPKRVSNKVVRSFVGDKYRVYESKMGCCRYGIRSFPEYENISSCLSGYSEILDDEYWISATILQEIFDPLYTGVIQRIEGGFIIEITKGHFLTKGVVPTSQYITDASGNVIEKEEKDQYEWLKIIEGHVITCICNNYDSSLVSINNETVMELVRYFSPVLASNSNVVEFGLLQREDKDTLLPYLIDFVDENSSINVTGSDIKNGIVSYGCITGKPVYIEDTAGDSLNEHFHNSLTEEKRSDEKIVFICKKPELTLLKLVNQYKPENIGFIFSECAMGSHLAVTLREKHIPAIKTDDILFGKSEGYECTLDAQTAGLLPEDRVTFQKTMDTQ